MLLLPLSYKFAIHIQVLGQKKDIAWRHFVVKKMKVSPFTSMCMSQDKFFLLEGLVK